MIDYRRRRLAPAAMLAVDDHIAACEQCRRLMRECAALAEPSGVLAQLGEAHLSYEAIEGYIEERSAQAERVRIESHLAVCLPCQEEVADLREFRGSLRQVRPVRRAQRLAAWIGVAAALLAAVAIWRWSATPGTPDLVAQAVAAGDLGVPAPILALRGVAATVRAPGVAAGFSLLRPVATAVLTDRPQFAWKPMAGARKYRVAIFAPGFHKVAESEWQESLEWTPDAPLERGQVYSWQVTAQLAAEPEARTERAPSLTDPEAKFQIVGGAQASELERATRQNPDAHLLLGVLYARAGALDAAELEFAAAPESRQSIALTEKLRELRR